MSDFTADQVPVPGQSGPHLDKKHSPLGAIAFIVVLAAGLAYAAFSINRDISSVGGANIATGAFVMLGIALLIALGFEFVNGFHVRRPNT